MNSTLHAHRLYLLLTLVAATLMFTPGPAAARTDVSPRDTRGVDVDPWASGAAGSSQPAPVDAWARGEAARAVVHDAWVSGQVRGSTNPGSPGRSHPIPTTTSMTPALLALGLLSAAVLGAMAAVAVGHRRRTPSAH